MVKALLDARCFESLSALAPVLRDLSSAGVEMPKFWDVVHNTAAADLKDPNFAHASICKTSSNRMLGLETRMVVFASKLYSDFLEKRAQALLGAAKKAIDVASRQQLPAAAKAWAAVAWAEAAATCAALTSAMVTGVAATAGTSLPHIRCHGAPERT